MLTPSRLARWLSRATGIGLLLIGIIHGLGYLKVSPLAGSISDDFREILRVLWLSFAVHYFALGGMVLIGAGGRRGSWGLLALAAAAPLLDGLLQISFLGFIPPTAILLVVAAIGLAAAFLSRAIDRST